MDSQKLEIYLMILAGVIAMMLMSGAIIVFVIFYQKRMIQEQMKRQALQFEHQQKLMQAELESQESERRRLAADLHDSIGGMLSTIRVGLVTVGKRSGEPSLVEETKHMLDDTISSVRRISRDLMPATLDKFGLSHALKELCERTEATARITTRFIQQGEAEQLDPQRKLMIFRIIQELLNNAVKHSQAKTIEVTLLVDNRVIAVVEDDGIGFDAAFFRNNKEGSRGLGLFNIENRVRLLSGEVDFQKREPNGSKTVLTLPLHA